MTTHRFGTDFDPAQYVEEPDPVNPGQVKRPDPGLHLLVQDATTGAPLPDIITETYGYWAYTTEDVPWINVSADGGSTWVGPLESVESRQAAAGAATSAAQAMATAQAAQTAVNDLQALMSAPGGIATLDGNGNLDPSQAAGLATLMQNTDGSWPSRPVTELPITWQFRISGSTPPDLTGTTTSGTAMVDGLDVLRDPFGTYGA